MKKIVNVLSIVLISVFLLIACGDDGNDDAVDKEITGVTAANVEVIYDGLSHGITVENIAAGDIVEYSQNGSIWSTEQIKYTYPSENTVYYKVTRKGYKAYISSAEIIIKNGIIDGISASDVTYIYDGQAHGIQLIGIVTGDTVTYSTDGETFDEKCEITEVGEHTVYYRVERDHSGYASSCTVTILPKIQGRYVNDQAGLITLMQGKATVDRQEKSLLYDVTGSGTIGGQEFGLQDGILTYGGKEYKSVDEDDYIYELDVNVQSIYVVGGAEITVNVRFENDVASVKVDGNVVTTVEDVNYCENIAQLDYADTSVETTVRGDGEITNFGIELSKRAVREKDDISVQHVYDGSLHSFEIELGETVLYKTGEEYETEAPEYTEVGVYRIEIVYITEGYVPTVVNAEMTIVERIDGVYYNVHGLIQITGDKAIVNGVDGVCRYADGKWHINGKAVEVANGKLVDISSGEEYTKQLDEALLVLNINGNITVMIRSFESLMIVDSNGTVTVYDEDMKELATYETQGEITVTVNDEQASGIPDDDMGMLYIIGASELNKSGIAFVVIVG